MSDHLTFDLVEDILLRLDGEDLIRCKSVCKSWLSFISSSSFVKSHLNYNYNRDYNNHKLGHRRIMMPTHAHANMIDDGKVLSDNEYYKDKWCIVGSCNGLVCFSTSLYYTQVVVTNPMTREVKKLQTFTRIHEFRSRWSLCWGFGYDSFTDDYKVVMGTQMDYDAGTLFQVLTLKSNLWKVMKQVKYNFYNPLGILWNGALHWFMQDCNSMKKVILSFDLSREEFEEIPQPFDSRYVGTYLGITEGCLCIYLNDPPYERWVMKNYNDKQSWELLPGCETNTYDVAHMLKCYFSHKNWCLCDEDDYKFYSKFGKYIRCPIYVHSLVSPHLNGCPKKKRHTEIKRGVMKGVSN
ncbi:putative F-box domain-containing protein [Tanacetum coccineum]